MRRIWNSMQRALRDTLMREQSQKRVSLHPRENFRNKCFCAAACAFFGVRLVGMSARPMKKLQPTAGRPAASRPTNLAWCASGQAGSAPREYHRHHSRKRERKNNQHQKVSGRIVHIFKAKVGCAHLDPQLSRESPLSVVAGGRSARRFHARGVKRRQIHLSRALCHAREHRKYFHASRFLIPLRRELRCFLRRARTSHTKNFAFRDAAFSGKSDQTGAAPELVGKNREF
jgi:hypothetical protein